MNINSKRATSRAMKSLIDMNCYAKISFFWRANWPVFLALFFAYLGGLWAQDYASSVVLGVGAAGIAIFLPLFNITKCLWLYIAAFFLCIANDVTLNDAKYITNVVGIEWLSPLAASIVLVAVQGAVITFAIMLLCTILFRSRANALRLIKIPLCMLFLLAALDPAFTMFWLFLGLCGFLGPI